MKKEEALRIIVDCAKVYRDNLANRHLLFVFQDANVVKSLEVICLPRNYMHLTGVLLVDRSLKSAGFYDLCIRGELAPSSFELN